MTRVALGGQGRVRLRDRPGLRALPPRRPAGRGRSRSPSRSRIEGSLQRRRAPSTSAGLAAESGVAVEALRRALSARARPILTRAARARDHRRGRPAARRAGGGARRRTTWRGSTGSGGRSASGRRGCIEIEDRRGGGAAAEAALIAARAAERAPGSAALDERGAQPVVARVRDAAPRLADGRHPRAGAGDRRARTGWRRSCARGPTADAGVRAAWSGRTCWFG